jgi:5,10-methylene-tetrahydrofolate dehydrogenase/methenyl tetrahydrofolate cyclohydrolase
MEQKPGLAVILVGARTDSATYVRMKRKACLEVGIHNFSVDYDETVTQDELLEKIDQLNKNPDVHGILIQLPLPRHINEDVILQHVVVDKDVDGLHPLNMASLSRTQTHTTTSIASPGTVSTSTGSGSNNAFSFSNLSYNVACTPQGCIELLDRIGCQIESKRAVVLGRSNIVGVPVALLLMQRNATVTIVHSRSIDVPALVREADIVIAAVGRPELVRGDWLKPGAVVIDVGVNSVPDSTKKKGYRLVGDCHYDSCVEVAGRITPVPGGVGPMTIAMLLRNTMNSAMRSVAAAAAQSGKMTAGVETLAPPTPPTHE